jgi:hypothetical protein
MHPVRALLASASAAAGLLAAPGLASALIPTGSFEIQFGGNQSIWMGEEGVDAGEEFCNEFEAEFDVLESCDFEIFVDGKGKIYGYLGFSGWIDGLYFDEGGPIRGTQRGDDRSGISRISLKIKLTGTTSDGFETLPNRWSLRYSGQTTAEGLLSGLWTARVCINGVGCNEAENPVPPTTLSNGGWSLQIEITDEGNDTLSGSARVEFGDGSECFYSVSGRYSARRDTARLSLLPTEPECAGTWLRLKDVRLLPQSLEPRFGRRSFVWATPSHSPSITYRLFGFRGATHLYLLPGQGALEDYYSNPEIFAFICQGTVEIAASVDPAACVWTIRGSNGELTPLEGSIERPAYTYSGGVSGGLFGGGTGGASEIEMRSRLIELGASATVTVVGLP